MNSHPDWKNIYCYNNFVFTISVLRILYNRMKAM